MFDRDGLLCVAACDLQPGDEVITGGLLEAVQVRTVAAVRPCGEAMDQTEIIFDGGTSRITRFTREYTLATPKARELYRL